MIREARASDAPAITAFLRQHIESSMFLLSNLEQHGIGQSDHLHATRFFLTYEGASLRGVFGCTNGGYLMCQHPEPSVAVARDYLAHIAGVRILSMTGPEDQVAQFVQALPYLHNEWLKNEIQPLFMCDLTDFAFPEQVLTAPLPKDRAMLEVWFRNYLTETGIADSARARMEAAQRATQAITDKNVRLYCDHGGTPIGMTAVNARAGHGVQIGGVYVHHAHRGQGHAGRMVAAQLAELRAAGARNAVLFAASTAAAKAYTRIGFRQIGGYRIAMLRAPCAIGVATCP
ncbi:MAG: GNAT family N-acetyltransferase [Rhodobacteraceae bacterium]|nr:GNAT family N-acetyltransferase [Paracoccaceae bacterium]